MQPRELKDLLYEQVARIGKAASSPKRLELVELLCQGEKSVEALAKAANIDVKNASSHLKELKAARLVESRKEGKYMFYRLADESVAAFWVAIRALAEDRLAELSGALRRFLADPQQLTPLDRKAVLDKAQGGEILMLDVRPREEYEVRHLPHARSLPLDELERRLMELPRDRDIVAYCRGPFCLMAKEAVSLLRGHGFRATMLEDGVAEWRAAGLPVASGPTQH